MRVTVGAIEKAKGGRGAAGKVPVFGLLKRSGKGYTNIIPNARKMTLLPIVHQMITPDSIWNQAKRNLRKYNGNPHSRFPMFLKECEWRFNYGPPKQFLTTLKYWVKPYLR